MDTKKIKNINFKKIMYLRSFALHLQLRGDVIVYMREPH